MNRSSSRKDLRAERLAVTPYARSPLRRAKSTSWNPVASLRNFAQSLVGRSTDDMSVSGSEEDWNGEAPEIMRGEDVFSLAAAAGRGGAEFEDRAQTWREGKAKLRASKAAPESNWGALALAEPEEGAWQASTTTTLMRNSGNGSMWESSTTTFMRTPQMPPRDSRPSGSTIALRRFMEDKGVRFDAEDAQVLEGLAHSLRSEATKKENQTPVRLGGWSGATPSTFISKSQEAGETPGSNFSIGTSAPLPPRHAAQRKITYLGPGMSPRRLTRAPKPVRKPIFESLEFGKKRKTDSDAIEVDETPTPEVAAAASVAAAFNAKRKAPARSPLAQVTEPSPKRAGDDVLRDLIDETIGPEATHPSIVINPYEDLSPAPSGKIAPLRSSLRKSSSSMKASMRGSASRGAAEKLVNVGNSTRKKSTLEMVSNYKSSRDTASSVSVSPSPEPVNPGAALKASTLTAPSPPRASKAAKLPAESSFQAHPVASLSSSTMKSSTPKRVAEPEPPQKSAAVDAIVAKPPPAPVFNPPSIALGPPPDLPQATTTPSRSIVSRRTDPSAIYLSAKDSALNVDKAALPFYTFTLSPGSPEPSPAVQKAARASPAPTFEFTMNAVSSTFVPSLPAKSLSTPAQWTCDLCMLQNPDSAKEKCTVCEAPRPGAAPAPSAPAASAAMPAPPSGGFAFGKPAAKGEWECGQCMLKNPDSAKDKCGICEFPRPGAAPAAAAPPAALPAPPSGGFTFGQPAANGEWTCKQCDLKNPSTATEKCTICDHPKPGAKPAAAAPPALPTPPAGGFSFGGAPSGPSSGFSFGASASTPSAPSSGFSFGSKPTAGEWTCKQCDLKNPSTATEKCTICDHPKPGATPAPAALPTPPSGGFSFGGLPAPPSGGFSFGGKPVSSASNSSASAAIPGLPAPPSGGFTFGKSAPAPTPLLKPTGGAGEWTCSTCGLQNPASATEKCTICDTAK